jgi:hypothetical protein
VRLRGLFSGYFLYKKGEQKLGLIEKGILPLRLQQGLQNYYYLTK